LRHGTATPAAAASLTAAEITYSLQDSATTVLLVDDTFAHLLPGVQRSGRS
jgi:hypothetical protein